VLKWSINPISNPKSRRQSHTTITHFFFCCLCTQEVYVPRVRYIQDNAVLYYLIGYFEQYKVKFKKPRHRLNECGSCHSKPHRRQKLKNRIKICSTRYLMKSTRRFCSNDGWHHYLLARNVSCKSHIKQLNCPQSVLGSFQVMTIVYGMSNHRNY
jgi:hypothetical protein